MCFFEEDPVENSWERTAESRARTGLSYSDALDEHPGRAASPARPTLRSSTGADPAGGHHSRSASPRRPTPAYAMEAASSGVRSLRNSGDTLSAGTALPNLNEAFDRENWRIKRDLPRQNRDEKYKVHIGAKLIRRHALLDTEEVIKHFSDKQRFTTLPAYRLSTTQKGAPISGVGTTMDAQRKEQWKEAGLIWVWCGQSNFYSHVPKVGRFHHSSLVAGEEVQGAGQWIVQQGYLKKINGLSGHYRPSLDHLHRSVLAMEPACDDDTTVLLWDKTKGAWEDVPWRAFKHGVGERYQVSS